MLAAGTVAGGAACSHPVPVQTLCGEQSTRVAGGSYIVQNDEYGSTAAACVATDGNAGFTVIQSSISMPTDGGPGGYPSIYQGCHWGQCSSGGLASMPVRVSGLVSGMVTTSWATSQPPPGSIYNVVYDIWFSRQPHSPRRPDCTELMVWLDHSGNVQPYGHRIAAAVSVGGYSYDVWAGRQ